jgi:hypothetical protein
LNAVTVEVLGSPKIAERYVGQGLDSMPSTSRADSPPPQDRNREVDEGGARREDSAAVEL